MALSLTGGAQYGETQRNGANPAAAQINASAVPGVKLTLVIDDDANDPNQVQSVFQKFVTQDKVDAIVGPTLSNPAQVADPYAQQNKVAVLGVSNTAVGITDIGDYICRDSLTEADVVPQTIQKSHAKLGYRSVAVLYANGDAFGKSGYDACKAALDKNSIRVVDTETFSTNDSEGLRHGARQLQLHRQARRPATGGDPGGAGGKVPAAPVCGAGRNSVRGEGAHRA